VNLDSIDKTLSSILASITKSKATVGVVKERLLEAKERKQELSWIKNRDIKLHALESLEQAKIENNRRSTLLAELLESGRLYAEKRDVYGVRLSGADFVLGIALRRLKIGRRVLSMKKLLESARKLKKIVRNRPAPFEAAAGLYRRLKKILAETKEFNTLIEEADRKLSEVKPLKKRIKSYTEKIDKMMKERCPLCQKKL
jgi:hypothetical protein